MRKLSWTYMDNGGHISEHTGNREGQSARFKLLARERRGNSLSRIPDNDELDMVPKFRQYCNIDAQVVTQQLSKVVA